MTDGQSELARDNTEYVLLVKTVVRRKRGPLNKLRELADYYESMGYEIEYAEEGE